MLLVLQGAYSWIKPLPTATAMSPLGIAIRAEMTRSAIHATFAAVLSTARTCRQGDDKAASAEALWPIRKYHSSGCMQQGVKVCGQMCKAEMRS